MSGDPLKARLKFWEAACNFTLVVCVGVVAWCLLETFAEALR